MNKTIVVCLLFGLAWAVEAFLILFLEAFQFSAPILKIMSILLLVTLLIFHAYFFVVYFKGRKKVKLLQQQYIDTLKPEAPLRFCPTDEQLMEQYFERQNSNELQTNEKTPLEEKVKQDDELERE